MVAVCVLFLAPVADALATQDTGDDLLDLSLEELLSLRVPSMTNVLGGHTHNKGEIMPMVHFMHMEMDGLRDGTNNLSPSDVLAPPMGPPGTFPVVPTEMTMDMLMLGLMYAPSDALTLMAMIPYHWKSMDHQTVMGGTFTTKTEGFGDLRLGGIGVLWETDDANLLFDAGMTFPTGSIDEKDATPAGPDSQLPYPMQLGSGTYDLVGGLTYTGESPAWGWGGKATGVVRLDDNDRDYTLGDRVDVTGWIDRKWTERFSTSARVVGLAVGNVEGADPELNQNLVPTADPDRQGKRRIDLALGAQLLQPAAADWRLGVEFGTPVYEDLDGPQLSTEWWATVNLSVTIY